MSTSSTDRFADGSRQQRIVVLDPGFAHSHAHHLTVNLGIAAAARHAGHVPVIVASQTLDRPARQACVEAGALVTAYWNTPGYPADAERLSLDEHERLTRGFSEEIRRLFDTGFVEEGDPLHVHTCFSFHLQGLARALWLLQDRPLGRIIVSMMFPPGACVLSKPDEDGIEIFDPREFSRYRHALGILNTIPRLDLSIATSCRAYQRVYQKIWNRGEILLHPSIVHRALRLKSLAGMNKRPRVLLYLGGPKSNKGLEFSARVGANAAASIPDAEFVLHFNSSFPGAELFQPLVAELRSAGEKHRNITIVEGHLDDTAYDQLISSVSVVCLFYDPSEYRFKTSGVLWDLLQVPNIRWIVSKGTWLAAELEEIGISHLQTPFGDVERAVDHLKAVLTPSYADRAAVAPRVDTAYVDSLLQPYGTWLVSKLTRQSPSRHHRLATASSNAPAPPGASKRKRERILVVRTHYGHFSPLSGPGGFVPWLRTMGLHVDEWLIPLGHEALHAQAVADRDRLLTGLHQSLRSYQGNAVPFESRLQRCLGEYDVVHFVDGEHCGLLSALARKIRPFHCGPRLVATFHQPVSVLQDIIPNRSFLGSYDCIHLLAPSQGSFFEGAVPDDAIRVVPHGIAPELLEDSLPPNFRESTTGHTGQEVISKIAGRRIVLCVGTWLRDHQAFLGTADLFQNQPEFVFIIVGKGLTIDTTGHPNVLVFDRGLSDVLLHDIYRISQVLLLPLKDAAANNAILEAMTHDLPIVTTDLPATRFYTQDSAIYCENTPASYEKALRKALEQRSTDSQPPSRMVAKLRANACTLAWPKIAAEMSTTLYENSFDPAWRS